MVNSYKEKTLAERCQIQSIRMLVFSESNIGGYLHSSNTTISLDLKRCHLGDYTQGSLSPQPAEALDGDKISQKN
ncbi:MAG: hypothetical protein QS748_05435 [Candidatus Endonucleobacter bathymodioli]|uniref:Uncharacterized protein n=1 Tax=Candidatus Endonucleibacter bathymodioli TaxID=539814 RepID=A0AA90NKK5_9GAMM|nr:hypothetical protein [Candidatus Endonucleobacter bathymodioli]